MEDTEEARQVRGDLDFGSMRERVGAPGSDSTLLFEEIEIGVPGNAAESENGVGTEDSDLAFKIGAAIEDFRGEWLVFRGRTADSSGDVDIGEVKTIVAADGCRLIGESSPVESFVQEVAGTVTGEDAAGAVASMRRWRETENEKMRTRIAESGHAAAPVVPVAERTALFAGDSLAVGYEPGALAARDNLVGNDLERGRGFHFLPLRMPARTTA